MIIIVMVIKMMEMMLATTVDQE